MIDFRPVGYVIGLLVAALGVTMLVPMALDLASENGHWQAFLESAAVTVLIGGAIAAIVIGFFWGGWVTGETAGNERKAPRSND